MARFRILVHGWSWRPRTNDFGAVSQRDLTRVKAFGLPMFFFIIIIIPFFSSLVFCCAVADTKLPLLF